MIRITGILIFLSVTGVHAQNKPLAVISEASILHRSQKALTDIMVHDIFSPPVASRIYVYTNIAAYEVIASQQAGYKSLYNQVRGFPAVPVPTEKIHFGLAAVQAFLLTAEKLLFSEQRMRDSAQSILQWYSKQQLSKQQYKASLRYGQLVSGIILGWAGKDQYKETRNLKRYTIKKEEGKWLPTPPGYMAAIEPYWERIRAVTLDSATQFKPPPPFPFSKDSSSRFYKEAFEVYEKGKALSFEDSAIASFWDCNPFYINTKGHLNFATKKISPGGHWMSIVTVACKKVDADIAKSAAAYTYASIALFDAFIACWAEKYRSNVIRPETYINAYVDESWRPILQTPPFPEYNSGHSVISAAAATVLTHFLGESFAFNDDTEVEFGLPIRSFTSFMNASEEAAISRMYGGIHYRSAIENGQVQGAEIGNWVIKKIQLKAAAK